MKGIFNSFKALSINKDDTSIKSETAPAPAVDGFKFEFSLDKKKKKKKKKKSGAKATVAGENDNDDEEEEDEEHATATTDYSFSEFNNTIVKDVTKLLDDDAEMSKKSDADTTVQPNSTNTKKKTKPATKQATQTPVTASNPIINAATEKNTSTSTNSSASNKKKGKSNTSTAKNNKNNVASIDEDDFDLLISQMNELNKKDLQNAPPPKKPATTSKGTKASGGSNNKPAAAPVKDTNPRFLSPKDPELDEQTKMKAKYGNGKNLVAIGPQKVRDPNWNSKNTAVTNSSSSVKNNSTVVDSSASTTSEGLTHSSVFSFSFGGL